MPRQTARQAGSLLVESSLASHSAETTPQLVGAPEAHLSDFPTVPESVPTPFPGQKCKGSATKYKKHGTKSNLFVMAFTLFTK